VYLCCPSNPSSSFTVPAVGASKKEQHPTMSLVALARGCATRGSIGLRKMGLLPAAAPRRFMGGGGGHQPISRSMEAELFGGHPKEPEGWETTIYLTYGATVILLAFVGLAPDTSIKTVSHINLPPPPPRRRSHARTPSWLAILSQQFSFFDPFAPQTTVGIQRSEGASGPAGGRQTG
jgi:hypothetical protein